MKLSISVVIPSLNSPTAPAVVRSVLHQTYLPDEVIVIGRDDGQFLSTLAAHERVQFRETPRPLSAAAARNAGAIQATGDVILFLDADCIADARCIEYLVAQHQLGQSVVGGSVTIEGSNYWLACDNLLALAPIIATHPAGARDYLPSLVMSVRRTLFEQLGGFDERFPGAAGEDIDFGSRVRAAGETLWFEPRARVAHQHPRTSARTVWNHLRRFGQLQVVFWEKYPNHVIRQRNTRFLRHFAGLLMAIAPLLAAKDIGMLYWQSPAHRPYWYGFPGMVWGKMAWYWGVAEALAVLE